MLSICFLCIFVDLTWLSMLFMTILLGSLDCSIHFRNGLSSEFLAMCNVFQNFFRIFVGNTSSNR